MCEHALFTGYTVDGGFAEYTIANEAYCLAMDSSFVTAEAAPLLCAGLIGYRTYRLAGPHAQHFGIYGFGAAAHILAQFINHQGKTLYAFTRPGDTEALIFAPVGAFMVQALRATRKGGVVVSDGIHMSDIPSFPYRLLWEERVLRSVANLTRCDGEEFMDIAPKVPVRTSVRTYLLEDANQALDDLRHGRLQGAAVLNMNAQS